MQNNRSEQQVIDFSERAAEVVAAQDHHNTEGDWGLPDRSYYRLFLAGGFPRAYGASSEATGIPACVRRLPGVQIDMPS